MVYKSKYVLDYPQDATISDIFLHYNIGGVAPDASAVIDGPTGNIIYTYSTLRSAVRRLAKYLQDHLQIKRGMVVSLLAFNTVSLPNKTTQKTNQTCRRDD
jgi:acyl-CoA synthetase (AMP-forming)/AMP-acid ligase II